MTWTLSTAVAEFFYCIIGLIFIGTGFKALKDPTCEKRITTAAFWFILAATFIAGPYFPRWITGLCVVLMAILTAFKRVAPSSSDVPAAAKITCSGRPVRIFCIYSASSSGLQCRTGRYLF